VLVEEARAQILIAIEESLGSDVPPK